MPALIACPDVRLTVCRDADGRFVVAQVQAPSHRPHGLPNRTLQVRPGQGAPNGYGVWVDRTGTRVKRVRNAWSRDPVKP